MDSLDFSISKEFVTVFFNQEPVRSLKRSCIKQYLFELKKIQLSSTPLEDFINLEKRAIRSYVSALLAKKDYLTEALKKKASLCGFDLTLIEEQLQLFKEKGYLDDQKLKQKLAIKKLKKGYGMSHALLGELERTQETKELELETLNKLIDKKRNLLNSPELKIRQKGYRFLLSRGYSITQIKQQLEKMELTP